MPIALVLGANGQDGSYLAEYLVRKGDSVIGADIHESPGLFAPDRNYEYRRLDLVDVDAVLTLLNDIAPKRIFHFAAVHGSAGFDYEPVWRNALLVNAASVHAFLEYLRKRRDCVMVYASSAKVFGDPLTGVITEDSPRSMTCPYSVTKLAAEGIIRLYRAKYGIKAGILNFFNHESPRRADSFLFPTLVRALHSCLTESDHVFEVGTLDFYCDWGSAEEYMELAATAAELAPGDDFIIASGKTWHGREFAREIWGRFGLDVSRHVRECRPPARERIFYGASMAKMRRILGRAPRREAMDVFVEMLKEYQKNVSLVAKDRTGRAHS
jgi:GDPmannose 4,6-dehydratase